MVSIRFYARLMSLVGPLILPHCVAAAPLDDTFGPLDADTFGRNGISNGKAAIFSKLSNGSPLAMAAVGTAQQHSTPALTNAGASVYFPQAGRYLGDAGQRSTKDTLWDFNDHINIDSTAAALANYQTDLIYDVGPALDGGSAPVGSINVTNEILSVPTMQYGSKNPMPHSLAKDYPDIVNVSGGPLDPNTIVKYNSGIQTAQDDWGMESIATDMQVVPLTAAAWLFGSALLGLFGVARRKKA